MKQSAAAHDDAEISTKKPEEKLTEEQKVHLPICQMPTLRLASAAASPAGTMGRMEDGSELNRGWSYHLWRWAHWAILFPMAVACGLRAGYGDLDPDFAYFPAALVAVICLLVETCYLALNRWRMSLAYLLLATTYLALTGGATITAFKLSRYLFAD